MEYSRDGILVGHPPGRRDLKAVPSYAIDIKAAWEIVEFMTSQQIRVCIENTSLRGYIRNYKVVIGEGAIPLGRASHLKLPVALCMAYLDLCEKTIH